MKNNLPEMEWYERIAKKNLKQKLLLDFLSHQMEICTTIAIIAQLIGLSQSSARRTALGMTKSGLLIEEKHWVSGKQQSLFGVSQAGNVFIEAPVDNPIYDNRITSNFIEHKIQNQRISIICQKQFNAIYTNERKLRNLYKNLKKIPDGLVEAFWTNKNMIGNRVFIEVELWPKVLSRYSSIYNNYLHSIEVDNIADCVLFLFPNKFLKGATRLLQSVPFPECPERDNLMAKRPYRFMVGSLEDFPKNIINISTGETVNLATGNSEELE